MGGGTLSRPDQRDAGHVGRSEEADAVRTADAVAHINQVAATLDKAVVKLAAIVAYALGGIVDARKNELSAVGVSANLKIDPRRVVLIHDLGDVGVMR